LANTAGGWCELPLRLVGKLDAELQCIKQHLIALVYIYEEKASGMTSL